jgi:hypothetical protein
MEHVCSIDEWDWSDYIPAVDQCLWRNHTIVSQLVISKCTDWDIADHILLFYDIVSTLCRDIWRIFME